MKGVSTRKDHGSRSLKLEAIAKCEFPRSMAKAVKSYSKVEGFYTNDCALEGKKFFGFTKHKLNFPPSIEYDSQYQIDPIKHSILAKTLGQRKEKKA